jgi:hypothetical protein
MQGLLYRLSGYSTKSPGGLPERPKGADCKSVGVCLRRFEPCTRHHRASRGPKPAPDLRKRGTGADVSRPAVSGWHRPSTAVCGEYAVKFRRAESQRQLPDLALTGSRARIRRARPGCARRKRRPHPATLLDTTTDPRENNPRRLTSGRLTDWRAPSPCRPSVRSARRASRAHGRGLQGLGRCFWSPPSGAGDCAGLRGGVKGASRRCASAWRQPWTPPLRPVGWRLSGWRLRPRSAGVAGLAGWIG